MLPLQCLCLAGQHGHLCRIVLCVRLPVAVVCPCVQSILCSRPYSTCLSPVYLPYRDCVYALPFGIAANRCCTDYLVRRSLRGVTRMLFGSQRAHPQGIPVSSQTLEAINR